MKIKDLYINKTSIMVLLMQKKNGSESCLFPPQSAPVDLLRDILLVLSTNM